jgi:hypothetical protein
MALKTPFFSAFGPLLFGRRKHRKTPVIEEDFNAFQSVLGGHLSKKSLAAPKSGAHSRHRDWSLEVTFWAFLYQVLGPACACREVVRKVQAWCQQRRRRVVSGETGAYCLARAKLPLALLGRIFSELAGTLERRMSEGERWLRRRRVKILDGTGLSMPDTLKNQKRWPQPRGQKPGCGFPLLRMAGLFCMGSGALLRYAFGNKHDQENWLCRGVLNGLEKDDVLLADRGFCSFGLIAVMLARGVDCVMRLHQARRCDFRQGKRLGRNDRLVSWRKNPSHKNDPWASEHAALPAMIFVRLVRFRVEVPGFRTEQVIVATTLLDPKEYPAEVLAGLYRARWNIELRYREIKTTMGAEVLRCKSPAMVEKELCMNAIGYNLIRCVMQEAAQSHDVELGRLSFKGTLDTVRHFADTLHAATGTPRRQRQIYEEMLGIIARDTLPSRPDRSEPRARKRRPKPYQLLTKPRHQMRVIPHRNRYRATDADGLN